MCRKNLKIYGRKSIEFLGKALNLGIFTHSPFPHSKLYADCFQNLFPPAAERGWENYDFMKTQSENMKMISNIRLFIFCMISIFSKCDGLTVL